MADYGHDHILLDEAHVTLDDPRDHVSLEDLKRQIRIDGISGSFVFSQPQPMYPAGLGKVIAQLRPSGAFSIGAGSWYAINRKQPGEKLKPKADYYFRVATAGGAFALTPHKAPVTNIVADATVSPMRVNIPRFRGDALGGTLIAVVDITPVKPVTYTGLVTLYNVDLQKAAHDLEMKPKKPIVGKAYVKTRVLINGAGGPKPPLQSLAMDGEFQIVNANFGNITAIRAAANPVAKPEQSLDGQASGLFDIRDKVVTLKSCTVGNPMFGLIGSGTVGFDNTVDVNVVAAPLGDWAEALCKSKVPILDVVGSSLVSPIQAMFNTAQRTLLWDIRVRGTTSAPKIDAVPAPVITEPVAALFGQMLQGKPQVQVQPLGNAGLK